MRAPEPAETGGPSSGRPLTRARQAKPAKQGKPASVKPGSDRLGEAKSPLNPISQRQIETVLSRAVGGIGLVFALQSLPVMLGQADERLPLLGLISPLVLGLVILLVVLATIVKSHIRTATGAGAIIYLLALVAWPFLSRDPSQVLDGKPWLWYVCTVATSYAAIAFPLWWAAAYTLIAPLTYGAIRMLPSGGGADVVLASLDAVYAILLGQVVLIIIFMLRQATAAVDIAQSNALGKYGMAVRQHATEIERVEVDSIVHDSVLTTLLSAAAARSPQEAELAADMARQAIARLNDAGQVPVGDETVIPFTRLSHRIRQAANAFAGPFTIIEDGSEFLALPVHTSDALYSATVQAMVNSMQHAGPADASLSRTLTLSSNRNGGCTIEVADAGIGFDLDAVPTERLGLRISIQERVISAGGAVTVRTRPGHGTSVRIEWPRPDAKSDRLVSQFSAAELPALGLDDTADDRPGGLA
ncbi:sensor histidine kinase [Glaciibacter sp. 2TAF33]|uniref:sensor histidine kinase n=1 Tax=Glaciibacter sp. 2TAF33 TaxID=3233015 RepID=UPI003F92C305